MSRMHLVAILAAAVVGAACSHDATQPDPPVPTTIVVTPATATLTAIGATQTFNAAVRDQNNQAMAGQTIVWASSAAGVATVSAAGLVTAVANGTATITASVGSVQGSAAVTVAQALASVAKTAGDAQTDTAGQTLPTALEVEARDGQGNPMPGVGITFAATQGGGSVGTPSATTGANGRASTTWTIGTIAGAAQTVTATAAGVPTATFTANATAAAPDTIALVSGDAQTGAKSNPLSDSLVVRVADAFGNPVQGATVTFAATGGGGSLSPTSPVTGTNGQAAAAWTLGPTPGANTAEAQLSGVTGSPVMFSATGTDLLISSVTPDTLTEAGSATVHGSGFDLTPANNTVTVDGVVATVTAAFADSLQISVPNYSCLPARSVGVVVQVGGAMTNTVNSPLVPTGRLNMAVGERLILTDPTSFCLQFAASTVGADAYVIGVGAAAELATSTMPMSIASVAGLAPAPGFRPSGPLVRAPAPTGPITRSLLEEEWWSTHPRAELQLRAWEQENLRGAPAASAPGLRRSAAAAMAVPSVGDTLLFKIATNFSNPCNVFTTATTVVRAVGSAGIWVTDVANPTTDSLTTAQIQAYSDTFDTSIYAQDTLYLGVPSDIDTNMRAVIILSIEVNKNPLGVAGFVFSGDLVSTASCAQSNGGEIYYSHVPDPGNASGTGARSQASILFQMPSLIAHEFAHIIQQSRRVVLLGGQPMVSWEAEGQASFAEELVGHAILSNSSGQDYGASVVNTGQGPRWYQGQFNSLAQYFGWQLGSSQDADGPELCSLFATTTLVTPCNPFAFYGASYAFFRFISDQYAATYGGGLAQLQRDWIGKSASLRGRPNVEALLGLSFDSLFARWGAMLYADGRVPGLAADLELTSWDLFNIFNSFNVAARLAPVEVTYGTFSQSHSVRGGSTQYYRVSAAGARAAAAVRIRDQADAVLGTTMRPLVWIVRTQ